MMIKRMQSIISVEMCAYGIRIDYIEEISIENDAKKMK